MRGITVRTGPIAAFAAAAALLSAGCDGGRAERRIGPEDCAQPGVEKLLGSSLLPDPDERRMRREHALAGEVAATLRELPGVAAARVHLSLPDAGRFGRKTETPGRAAVILRGDPAAVLGAEEIARLVTGAVPGLAEEDVTVSLHPEPVACPGLVAIGPVLVTGETATLARLGVAALLVVCLGLAAGMLLVGLRLRRMRS